MGGQREAKRDLERDGGWGGGTERSKERFRNRRGQVEGGQREAKREIERDGGKEEDRERQREI